MKRAARIPPRSNKMMNNSRFLLVAAAPAEAAAGGRAPAKRKTRAYVAAFFLVWAAFVGVWWYQNPPDGPVLWVVNGLAVPVDVAVGGGEVHLEPASYQSIELDRGEYQITVTGPAGEIASEDIEIKEDRELAVYNILGAAWVYGENIYYTQYGAPGGDSEWQLYAFEAFHDIPEEVHYAFTDIPSSVSVSGENNVAWIRYVGIGEGQAWDWQATLNECRRQGLNSRYDALAEDLRRVMPEYIAQYESTGSAGQDNSVGGGK